MTDPRPPSTANTDTQPRTASGPPPLPQSWTDRAKASIRKQRLARMVKVVPYD